MPGIENPWDIPEWHALRREVMLVRHLVGVGATALGKANYAEQGEYYTAFFGLSVGLERLAKLILVADHALSHNGQMPSKEKVKSYGHRLSVLMDAAEPVALKHDCQLQFTRPTTAISAKIVECLDAFAAASRGRYANFAALGDPNLDAPYEPICMWWNQVADLILKERYYGKRAQALIESRARQVDAMLSGGALVLYLTECGHVMRDVWSASVRTGQTELVQRYGRFHTLTIVRWLSNLFSELSLLACYHHHIDAFGGVEGDLRTYTVDDHFLKTRKTWPLN